MGLLELNLLGSPQVLHAGEELHFRSRKAVALLAYLCLEPGAHTRARLAGLLWPESDSKSARANLRSTLMYLRKPLRHEEESDELQPHLMVERGEIEFNRESDYALDLDAWRQLPAEPEPEALAALLERGAVVLMEGFNVSDAGPFEEWLRGRQERWQLELSETLDRLSQELQQHRQNRLANELVSRWLELDPFAEVAYRRRMELQLAQSQATAALQTYAQLRELLQDELGVEPAPATQELAERVRRARDRSERPSSGPGVRSPLKQLPFVGRQQAQDELIQAYKSTRAQEPQVAVLAGEAGIGKSRLAEEFAHWAGADGAQVLRAGGSEAAAPRPYQELVDALRPTIADVLQLDAGLGEVWLRELARLFPEIQEDRPGLEPATGDPTRTVRLYESVNRLISQLAQAKPVLLFLDDLQWLDPASLDLLAYLAGRWHEQGQRIMLLACVRSEALRASAHSEGVDSIAAWLRSLARQAAVHRIEVGRLSESEASALLERLFEGGDPDRRMAELTRWLLRETQGHPFYLAETLQALAEEELLQERQQDGAVRIELAQNLQAGRVERTMEARNLLPRGVKDVVRSRLERLPPHAMELLAAGSVLAGEFEFDWARQVADLDQQAALKALDAIESADLWRPHAADARSASTFAFSHDKIRDVVYTEAGSTRRRLFHSNAYRLLKSQDANPSQLAHHANQAGKFAAAFRHATAAGRIAMETPAVRAALPQFELARRLLAEQTAVNQELEVEQISDLYRELARAYELTNAWDQARAVYREYLGWTRERGLRALESRALARLAGVDLLALGEDYAQTEELLNQAISVARQADDRSAEAEAHATLSHMHFIASDRDQATEHAEIAVDLAEGIDDRRLLAQSLNALSYAIGLRRPAERVVAVAGRARDLFAELDDTPMEIDCAVRVGTGYQLAGSIAKAEGVLEQAIQTSREIENDWGLMNGLNHIASVHLDRGRLGAALQAAQESVAVARDQEGVPLIVNSLNSLGFVQRCLGQLERAVACHREARELAVHNAPPQFGANIAAQLCADYWLLDDRQQAAEALDHALTTHDHAWIYRFDVEPLVVAVLLDLERGTEARAAVERLAVAAQGNPRLQLPLHRCRALLEAKESGVDAQLEQLYAGLQCASDLELEWPRWELLVDLVVALRGADRDEELQAAEDDATKLQRQLESSLEPGPAREAFRQSSTVRLQYSGTVA